MNGYNLGIIRVPADLEAKYKKMLTSKQMQFKEIWNFNFKKSSACRQGQTLL